MYSSVAEAEYQFRKSKAEEEARAAYDRSAPFREPVSLSPSEESAVAEVSSGNIAPDNGSGLRGLLSRIKEDDVLLIGILFLLFNENKDDDPLILMILAVLLFS